MALDRMASHTRNRRRRGFTLIEILVVGVLIALFSGMAIFSVQRFYDDARRKIVFDETKQIGTALEFAFEGIGFFPRLHMLGQPLSAVVWKNAGGLSVLAPAFDTYGYLIQDSFEVQQVEKNWDGVYMSAATNRLKLSQGQKGLVTMRIPDPESIALDVRNGVEYSLVYWPTDVWGNPYVVYHVVTDAAMITADNPQGLRLIERPSEMADKFNAVVSYGPNGVPGGNDETRATGQAFLENVLRPGSLYIAGDAIGGEAEYTLKTFESNASAAQFPDDFNEIMARTLSVDSDVPGEVGMFDANSDDIYWKF